jgi:hypothetical protein
MTSIRFTDVQARPSAFLDVTSLTLDEFQQLVLPFEAAFQARMAAWRLDGKPRTARQFAVYKNWALSQNCLFEAKSENHVLENQGLASPNFPVFGNLRQNQ